MNKKALRAKFEYMIPLDWSVVDPIEIYAENDGWPFIYIVLGGDIYSEAIIVYSFVVEDGLHKIDRFEFGRP